MLSSEGQHIWILSLFGVRRIFAPFMPAGFADSKLIIGVGIFKMYVEYIISLLTDANVLLAYSVFV